MDLLDIEGRRRVIQGCNADYGNSDIVVFGAPFDSTTSYRPGARFAPAAIRNESPATETFSPYLGKDLSEKRVCDAGDLELPFGDPVKVLGMIEQAAGAIHKDKKKPVILGGEHLIALAGIQAAFRRFPELHVIQLDAHADLRDEYLGCRLSHATVMRRVWDVIGDGKLHQYGIRSGEQNEFSWAKDHTDFVPFGFEGLDMMLEKHKDVPLYLSVDLDVLDPGIFPGTGTPEHGGVGYHALRQAICRIAMTGRVVAADFCELSPNNDPSATSVMAACTLLREFLIAL